MSNPFFKNHGPFKISELIKTIELQDIKLKSDIEISDIKDLINSDKYHITFYHSKKYKEAANKTRASFCITYENIKKDLPHTCTPLVVKNVLVSTSIRMSGLFQAEIGFPGIFFF